MQGSLSEEGHIMCEHQCELGRKNENIVDLFQKNSNVLAEVYSEPFHISKMETFSKMATKAPFGCLTGL